MKMNKLFKLFSVIVAAFLIITSIGTFSSTKVEAKSTSQSISELESKIASSEKQIKALESQKADQQKVVSAMNNQLDELNSKLSLLKTQISSLSGDITSLNSRISSLTGEISTLNTKITKTQKELDEKNQEIKDTVNLFCKRIRSNYMAGSSVSTLEILTSSSDLSTLLNRVEMIKRVTDSDQDLVDKLNKEIKESEKIKKDLTDQKETAQSKQDSLRSQKSTLVSRQSELKSSQASLKSTYSQISSKSASVNSKISSMSSEQSSLKESISEYQAAIDKFESQVNNAISNDTNKHQQISSGGWMWPVPYSSAYISSGYGYRVHPITGVTKLHSGIDITFGGCYGKDIVATKSGTVILVAYNGSGYGNYLIISHGGGYYSLYGHCSSVVVGQGSSVKQGQTIAKIGSTGASTGPHCHFEIRVGSSDKSSTVNPTSYVGSGY